MEKTARTPFAILNRCFRLGPKFKIKEILAIANFWIARCQRKTGRYESALKYVATGQKLALDLQLPKLAAVGQVLESWLKFQEGKPEEARRILKEAESSFRY